MANIANWVRIQMSGLVNSREKQLREYCKNLLITEHVNEILERLAKLTLSYTKTLGSCPEELYGF